MTLRHLAEFPDAPWCSPRRSCPPTFYVTHMGRADDGIVAMWAGDAGYELGDPDARGAWHRLRIGPGPWRLERTIGDEASAG